MPICHQRKLIFYHIPKCAGSSIEKFFGFKNNNFLHGVVEKDNQVLTLHHLTQKDLIKYGFVDNATLESYFSFTIIRDPFNRMASDYVWQQKHDIHALFSDMTFNQYIDFAEQVISETLYFKKPHFDHFRPMTEYCLNGNRKIIDAILTLENIENGLKLIEKKTGEIVMPKRNSNQVSYDNLRTPANINRIYSLYEEDKVLFDNTLQLEHQIFNSRKFFWQTKYTRLKSKLPSRLT